MILKVGDTYRDLADEVGDFEDWIRRGLNLDPGQVRVVDARHEHLPAAAECGGVVVSGSHAMVSDRLAWSERAAVWLRTAVEVEVPVLGICYGHQLLAHAFGGIVGDHPVGMEIGSVVVRAAASAKEDPLFRGLPSIFTAHTAHRQSVLRLPPEAVVLASNDFEPHHAFRIGNAAWGVQFHPEFDEYVMKGYLRASSRSDCHLAVGSVRPAEDTATLLSKFAVRAMGASLQSSA